MRQQRQFGLKETLDRHARELFRALDSDGWIAFWREISNRMAPRTGRFLLDDRRGSGTVRHNSILDNCAIDAANTLAAGFVSGACSPARPWFRSTTSDPDLAKYQPVREWFDQVDEVLRSILLGSNFYRASHDDFRTFGTHGNSAGLLLRDDRTVFHQYPMALGEFAWATNQKDEVDTCVRKFALTTSQMVERFGWERVSDRVQAAWNNGDLNRFFTIWHAIVPRRDIDPEAKGFRAMPWASYWWEESENRSDRWLHEGGFERFPVIASRWQSEPGEVYGYGPGAFAFGDTGQLQHQQLRKGQVYDFGTAPPLQGPLALSNDEINFLPGGLTLTEQPGTQPIKPIWQPVVPVNVLMEDILDVRQRIQRSFHVDMFLMLASTNDVQKTAREIAERSEERLLQVGPVVSRVNNDKLHPTLRAAFEFAMEAGRLPPAPEDLDGKEWRVEFTSIFAQAQKLVGVQSVERLIGTIGVLQGQNQEVVQKINYDELVDAYADMLGTPARLVISTDKVMSLRQARNEALAAKEQSALIAEQAGAVQKLASAPTGQGNALDLLSQLGGYGAPPAAAGGV